MGTYTSFLTGYRLAKRGAFTTVPTAREITARYPKHNPDTFANGVQDGLTGDTYRYRLILQLKKD